MPKGMKRNVNKTTVDVKKPEPNGLNGYRSMSDRAIQKSVDKTMGIAITSMFVSVLVFILSIVNTCLLAGVTQNGISTKADEWVECPLDNYVGYSVKKDWKTVSVETGVAFQPTDSEAISAYSQSVRDINKTRNVDLTHATLRRYIESDLAALDADETIIIENVSSSSCNYLGQDGYVYNFKQTTTQETGSVVVTYTKSIFFIYNDYLYSFAYTSAASYASPDFTKVLESIRVIPEDDRDVVIPVSDLDSEWIDKYGNISKDVPSLTSVSEDGDTTTTTSTNAETTTTVSD